MATKKRKRFNEGGFTEAEDKAAGLEASKDEKVGFFERLKMGNIDQEGSEAYNRFGAGRAKADRARAESKPSTDVHRVDSGPGALGMSDEDKPSTNVHRVDSGPGKLSTGATKITPTKRPSAPAPAPARAASSSSYRVDSGPGKLASRADTQSYTRKMGAAAAETAPATVTDTGSDMSRMLARAPAPAKAAPAKAAPAEKKSSYETPYDRMNRQNREAESSRRSAADAERATLRKNIRERNTGRVDPNTLLPESAMKKGGSVKGWGMARGARKAKIV